MKVFVKLLLITTMQLSSAVRSEWSEKSLHPYDAIISLGRNCQIAYQLKINGLRHYALPFDCWNTSFQSLCALLRNKFAHFLDREHFVLRHDTEKKDVYVFNTLYGVVMRHDFRLNEQFLEDYEVIRATYERRIARFYEVLAQSRNALFVRNKSTKEEAVQLDALLAELFPHLNYTLLMLDDTPEFMHDWGFERIKNYYLRQPDPYVWKGDNQAWREIFLACGLSV